MTRPPVNRELFGKAPPPPRDDTPVRVPLKVVRESDDAWLLSGDGRSAKAQWAPKSKVLRGEGREENLFRMPRWVAKERGWL